MNKCEKCGVNLYVSNHVCPLCHNTIDLTLENSIYPKVTSRYCKTKTIMKIANFIALIGMLFSILINYLVSKELSWSIFVVLGITTFMVTFKTGINTKHHFMKTLFAEIVAIIILAFLWDKSTGFHKWSITYVLPLICISYTITFLIIRIFTHKITKEHVLYTYLNSLIGLLPLYFILKRKIVTVWPSYTSIFTSIFAIIFLFFFNKKMLENEIERRFHI